MVNPEPLTDLPVIIMAPACGTTETVDTYMRIKTIQNLACHGYADSYIRLKEINIHLHLFTKCILVFP